MYVTPAEDTQGIYLSISSILSVLFLSFIYIIDLIYLLIFYFYNIYRSPVASPPCRRCSRRLAFHHANLLVVLLFSKYNTSRETTPSTYSAVEKKSSQHSGATANHSTWTFWISSRIWIFFLGERTTSLNSTCRRTASISQKTNNSSAPSHPTHYIQILILSPGV